MHSLVGMAAVLIAVAVVNNPPAFNIPEPMPRGNRLELFIGTFVGAITFSGSVIAFGKLAGLGKHFRLFSSAPVVFKGQHLAQPGACRRHGRVRPGVLLRRAGRAMAAVHRHDRDRLRARRADHHPDRRGRHAGGDLDAQQLFRLGRRRHRLLAQQHHADHRRQPGGLLRRDPVLHHVQGDEPLLLQRHPGRVRGGGGRGGGRRRAEGGALGQRRGCGLPDGERRVGDHRARATAWRWHARSTRSRRWRRS